MSLMVYPFRRDPLSQKIIDVEEIPREPFNDLFGFEAWRYSVWASPCVQKLGCNLLPSLAHADIYAEIKDLEELKKEVLLLKENSGSICKDLDLPMDSFNFRLDNALEAIRIAGKYSGGGVYIG